MVPVNRKAPRRSARFFEEEQFHDWEVTDACASLYRCGSSNRTASPHFANARAARAASHDAGGRGPASARFSPFIDLALRTMTEEEAEETDRALGASQT